MQSQSTGKLGTLGLSASTHSLHRALAKSLLDSDRPGDFNQALMEHGATVCTPKNPLCTTCPVQSWCKAYIEQNAAATISKHNASARGKDKWTVPDIEEADAACKMCGDLPETLAEYTVTRYPQKVTKKAARLQDSAVCIVERTWPEPSGKMSQDIVSEYLLVQRPASGLLGGLWEFPSVVLQSEVNPEEAEAIDADTSYTARQRISQGYVEGLLRYSLSTTSNEDGTADVSRRDLGSVKHLFSHIEQTYWAEHVIISLSVKPAEGGPKAVSKVTVTEGKKVVSQTTGRKSKSVTVRDAVVALPPVYKWVSAAALSTEAIPTGLKKVLALKDKDSSTAKGSKRTAGATAGAFSKRKKTSENVPAKSQKGITSFFGPR